MDNQTNNITLFDVVMKLNGSVHAVGETKVDEERYNNLERLIQLVDELLSVIETTSRAANHHAYSMAKIGKRAKRYLETLEN